jgi:hypothetical protein
VTGGHHFSAANNEASEESQCTLYASSVNLVTLHPLR